jgi:hypothetical protein
MASSRKETAPREGQGVLLGASVALSCRLLPLEDGKDSRGSYNPADLNGSFHADGQPNVERSNCQLCGILHMSNGGFCNAS